MREGVYLAKSLWGGKVTFVYQTLVIFKVIVTGSVY